MKTTHLLLTLLAITHLAAGARAQTSAFTFQGRLNDTGVPASGSYDLQLKLYDTAAPGTGTQVGATITLSAVPVTNGIFTVQPDFTANAFPGADRFVEIGVKTAGSGNAFNVLSPRQPITPTPYAIRSGSAILADSATNAGHASNADNASQATNANTAINATSAATATNATQLGGQPASNYVQTNDSRLSDARTPTAGSANYIQNTTTQQAGSFNIAGNGAIGGFLGIDTVNPSGLSKLEIAAQDGLRISGYQPFLTLMDTNGANKKSFLQSANGDAFLFTNSKAALTLKDVSGNVGIGTTTPNTKLTLNGGPVWTSNSWTSSMNLQNASALGWEANASGQRFGIGQSTGGLYFFRTNSAFGNTASPANYIMEITDNGEVLIGTAQSNGDTLQVAGRMSVVGPSYFSSGATDIGSYALHADGSTGSNNSGIYASGSYVAGYFQGNVNITGKLTKGSGSFKIDHPLDPANKYLYHSFVESPDMMNIYNGNVTTDAQGVATVILPAWFEALNQEFRYQLTAIGQFAQVIVSKEVEGNQFDILSDKPNVKVSWQVTGIRHDKFADDQRIPVEEEKPLIERGTCLYEPACK